jgi:hypothetical protein
VGTESAYIPLIAAGLGAAGSAMRGGGAAGKLLPYTEDFGFGEEYVAPSMLRTGARDISHLGAIAADRAATPVSAEGAFAQTPARYSGGGLPSDVALGAFDPATRRPALLGRPGLRFGAPDPARGDVALRSGMDPREADPSRWLFSGGSLGWGQGGYGAPRSTPHAQVPQMEAIGAVQPKYAGLRQPSEYGAGVQPGGGMTELAGALELLGVDKQALGSLTRGDEYPLFTGAAAYRRRPQITRRPRLPLPPVPPDDEPTP